MQSCNLLKNIEQYEYPIEAFRQTMGLNKFGKRLDVTSNNTIKLFIQAMLITYFALEIIIPVFGNS